MPVVPPPCYRPNCAPQGSHGEAPTPDVPVPGASGRQSGLDQVMAVGPRDEISAFVGNTRGLAPSLLVT